MRSFERGERLRERYELREPLEGADHWRAFDLVASQPCVVRLLSLPLPLSASPEQVAREQRRLLKELEPWREVERARPKLLDLFWEGRALCWVEVEVRGASLASLSEPLSRLEGLSLLEEVLTHLDEQHSHVDLMTDEPLLHLNLHPTTIVRGAEGELYLMDPLCLEWVTLSERHTQQRFEELEGARAPELSRGRADRSSDLYALAMSVLSAMSGLSLKRVNQRLQAERLLSEDLSLPPELVHLFERLVHVRTSERFKSALEALRALRALPRDLYLPLGDLLHAQPPPPRAQGSEVLTPQQGAEREAAPAPAPNVALEGSPEAHADDPMSSLEAALESELELGVSSSLALSLKRESDTKTREPVDGPLDGPLDEPTSETEDQASPTFYTYARGEGVHPSHGLNSTRGGAESEVVSAELVEGARGLKWSLMALLACLLGALAWWSASSPQGAEALSEPDMSATGVSSPSPSPSSMSPPPVEAEKVPLISAQSTAQEEPQGDVSLSRGESVTRRARPRFILIPSGEAWIGSEAGEGYPDERPRYKARLTAFELSQTEVTVRQYQACVRAGVCDVEGLKQPTWGDKTQCNWERSGRLDHPINCVNWRQALAFARWVGGRLPSEAEWSYAAQGGPLAPPEGRRYPWGERSEGCGYAVLRHQSRGEGCGLGGSAPVCSVPKGNTAQGLCDMVGNVWEWLTDEYHDSYIDAPRDGVAWALLPLDRWSTQERSLRGAAFDERDLPRIARRHHYSATLRLATVGFRVARDVTRDATRELTEPGGGAQGEGRAWGELLREPELLENEPQD